MDTPWANDSTWINLKVITLTGNSRQKEYGSVHIKF